MKTCMGISMGIVVAIGSIFYIINHSEKATKTVSNQKAGTVVSRAGNGIAQNKQSISPQGNCMSADKIIEKYRPQFQEMNTLAEIRVNSLLKQAKKEVMDKKDKHQNTDGIQVKYAGIFNNYEHNTEIQFDRTYKQIQEVVVQNEQSTALKKEFHDQYKMKKAERVQKFKQEFKKLI